MKKTILAILFGSLALVLALPAFVSAQQPIPVATPAYLPIAPDQYLPTWQAPYYQPPAPPTVGPTVTPFGNVTLRAYNAVYVFMRPTVRSVLVTVLAPGTVFTVRPAVTGWWQITDGPWANSYVQDNGDIRKL